MLELLEEIGELTWVGTHCRGEHRSVLFALAKMCCVLDFAGKTGLGINSNRPL